MSVVDIHYMHGGYHTELGVAYRRRSSDCRPGTIARVPFGRAGDYTVLGDVLLLLASEASFYMTASVLVVADGYSENGIA